MKYKVDFLEKQVSTVHWLTKIIKMNYRLDAEDIIEKYETVQAEHMKYVKTAKAEISAYKRKNKMLR